MLKVIKFVFFLFSVLKSNNTNILNYLMTYQNIDVMIVIKYALHLYDPEVKLIID